ncbi:MAG: amylo-alpha-1,6-glucosidase [Phycisphaerae bacterium]
MRMLPGTIDDWLGQEWLLADGRGGYAGSTVIHCPTRRYHGWFVWNRPGALNRWLLISHAAEHLVVGGRTFLLSNSEFNNAIDPRGYLHLQSYRIDPRGTYPAAEWLYQTATAAIRKTIWLARDRAAVTLRYEVTAREPIGVKLQIWPLIACREADDLRRKPAGALFENADAPDGFALRYRPDPDVSFSVGACVDGDDAAIEFIARPDWWYNFRYRDEAARGLPCGEDLYVRGSFVAQGAERLALQIHVAAGVFDPAEAVRACRAAQHPALDRNIFDADSAALLAAAAEPFVIQQPDHDGTETGVLLAGYPWLESYSRDACVALPGLLLLQDRGDAARRILHRMASLLRDGLLPNHIVDDAAAYEYTAADEPLWFVYAVDAYLQATGDDDAEARRLLEACTGILDAYGAGTQRDLGDGRVIRIGADPADGLIACRGADTAFTWMDARVAGRWTTPRAGKPIDVNALWYHALRAMADRLRETDEAAAQRYAGWAERVRGAFATQFWSDDRGYLADLLTADGPDGSLRPNQLLAIGLGHSPVDDAVAGRVLSVVTDRLLTPFGLRTLAPGDANYRGRYEGAPEQREAAAHNGSVYPWLIGFYVSAYLRVHGDTPQARADARALLGPLMEHLRNAAGLVGVSELFDGDSPHRPRGCTHQAWSTAELIRAWHLTEPPSSAAPDSISAPAALNRAQEDSSSLHNKRP